MPERPVRQLLHKNRCYAHDDVGLVAFLHEAIENVKQRYVTLDSRFVEPVHPVGPATVRDNIRQM